LLTPFVIPNRLGQLWQAVLPRQFRVFHIHCSTVQLSTLSRFVQKNAPRIIAATRAFGRKIRASGNTKPDLTACIEKGKNFFQKIEISRSLPRAFGRKLHDNR